jgi:YidC/Oxa1 family membrane protein insertase
MGIIILLAVNQPATAAPVDTPGRVIGHIAQKAGVTLEKRAGTALVPLGQVVSFTVSIKNESTRTINPTLIDELPAVPEGLALQNSGANEVLATSGSIETEGNTLTWTDSLAPGEEVEIVYVAIPPTTSTPDQTLQNVAVLTFGGTTLEAGATVTTAPPDFGGGFWRVWGSFINFIALALIFFDQALVTANIPFAFGFAIILFTVLVRAATFPLNMQQIKSSKAMQELQPKMKELQAKFKGDREKLAQEQMRLYKEHGVNPLGGCLPMIVQMPIWFALYRSLIQLSTEGLLNERFFWIPNLAGPVSTWGGGIDWLYPFPPAVGWLNAVAYLVMPVLLVVSQLYMQKLMTPPSADPQQAQMQSIMKFMPFMFGYFALIVPSGLTLYWFTSNILGVAQHYFTKTQMNQTPATAGASISPSTAPVPANPVPATPVPVKSAGRNQSKKRRHAKSKRKSRRKR